MELSPGAVSMMPEAAMSSTSTQRSESVRQQLDDVEIVDEAASGEFTMAFDEH